MYLIMSDCDTEIDRAFKIWEEYKKQDAAYRAELERYTWQKREYDSMSGAYEWIGNKYNELLTEKRGVKNSTHAGDANISAFDSWCKGEMGQGWFYNANHPDRDWWSGALKWVQCFRTPDQAKKEAYEHAAWEAKEYNYPNAAPPRAVSIPQPIPPNIQIACCLNKIDITNSKLDASQIKQSCKIQQKADQTVNTSESKNDDKGKSENKKDDAAFNDDDEEEGDKSNTIMYIVIAIIALLLLCSSSILSSILGGVIVM